MGKSSNHAFIYVVQNPKTGQFEHLVSLIPHAFVSERGLPGEAIMGKLLAGPDEFDVQHFMPNPRFIEFLHRVIALHVRKCPGFIEEAIRQREGYVYIIDPRTPTPEGEVPPEDIIGGVQIQSGAMVGYKSNPNYRVFTENGLMILPSWLQNNFLEEIMEIVDKPA